MILENRELDRIIDAVFEKVDMDIEGCVNFPEDKREETREDIRRIIKY